MRNVEVGKTYAYDIADMISTCHIGTYTVEVLKVHERKRVSSPFSMFGDYDDGSPIDPLADCRSIQTGEEFSCDVNHLTDLNTCKRIYDAYLQEEVTGYEKDILGRKIKRLEKVFETNIVKNKELNINFKPNLTKNDIKLFDIIIRFCVDTKQIEYCQQFSNLKKKLELYVAEQ